MAARADLETAAEPVFGEKAEAVLRRLDELAAWRCGAGRRFDHGGVEIGVARHDLPIFGDAALRPEIEPVGPECPCQDVESWIVGIGHARVFLLQAEHGAGHLKHAVEQVHFVPNSNVSFSSGARSTLLMPKPRAVVICVSDSAEGLNDVP